MKVSSLICFGSFLSIINISKEMRKKPIWGHQTVPYSDTIQNNSNILPLAISILEKNPQHLGLTVLLEMCKLA